jgi:hypothetical protein
MITRRSLVVRLYVHCLSCLFLFVRVCQNVQSYEVPRLYNPYDAFKINDNKIKIINTRRLTLDVKNFEDPSFDSRQRKRFVSFPSDEKALSSTQSHIQWISGLLSPGIKRPRPESDHSSLSRNQVKNVRSHISIYHYQKTY